LLTDLEPVVLPEPKDGHSWQTFMVVLDTKSDRNEVVRRLREQGVETALGAQALNALGYYKDKYGLSEDNFATATRLYQHGLALPVYGKLSEKDIDAVCRSLRTCLAALSG
jgi:dTDP-4-amino-4,6-dideoxygalactose transaminase